MEARAETFVNVLELLMAWNPFLDVTGLDSLELVVLSLIYCITSNELLLSSLIHLSSSQNFRDQFFSLSHLYLQDTNLIF